MVGCRLEGQDPLDAEGLSQLQLALPSFLLFATTWSVGATCDKAGRAAFDVFLKSKAAGLELPLLGAALLACIGARADSIVMLKHTTLPERHWLCNFTMRTN